MATNYAARVVGGACVALALAYCAEMPPETVGRLAVSPAPAWYLAIGESLDEAAEWVKCNPLVCWEPQHPQPPTS